MYSGKNSQTLKEAIRETWMKFDERCYDYEGYGVENGRSNTQINGYSHREIQFSYGYKNTRLMRLI